MIYACIRSFATSSRPLGDLALCWCEAAHGGDDEKPLLCSCPRACELAEPLLCYPLERSRATFCRRSERRAARAPSGSRRRQRRLPASVPEVRAAIAPPHRAIRALHRLQRLPQLPPHRPVRRRRAAAGRRPLSRQAALASLVPVRARGDGERDERARVVQPGRAAAAVAPCAPRAPHAHARPRHGPARRLARAGSPAA